MSKFHCPVCGGKIGFVQKYFQSSYARGFIECSSCKNKLHLKKYGASSVMAYLVILLAHNLFGVEKGCWPIYILLFIVLDFIQKMRSPLLLYNPKEKPRFPEWAIDVLTIIVLVVYFVVVFAI